MATRGLEDVEDGDRGGDQEEEVEEITMEEESVFEDLPDPHAPKLEDSVEESHGRSMAQDSRRKATPPQSLLTSPGDPPRYSGSQLGPPLFPRPPVDQQPGTGQP